MFSIVIGDIKMVFKFEDFRELVRVLEGYLGFDISIVV